MAGKRIFFTLSFLVILFDLFPQAAVINGWRHADYVYCSTEGGDSLEGDSPPLRPFFFDGTSYTSSTVLVRTADGKAIFYPDRAGIGDHTIVYGSIGSHDVTVIVTVKPKPPVTLSAFANVCSNAPAYSLFNADSSNVSPKNGRFSGPGVNGAGVFNPATAGPGVHTITYTAGIGSCLSSATRTLTVLATPVTGINPFAPVCEGAPPLTLIQGYPAGGSYSGPGVTGGIFDQSVTGIGTFPITYTYSNGTCTNSSIRNIIVSSRPVATFSGLGVQYCTDDAGVTLTGNPAGVTGKFSGPGISDGNDGTALFEPVNAGLGLHQIQYIYTSAQGCSDTTIQQVQVGTNVTINGLSAHYCINSSDVEFTALPVGGSFTAAPGLTDGGGGNAIFSPSLAGIGVHNITYTFIDGNGCINVRSIPVTVHALPVPAINNLQAAYCANNPLVTISGNYAPSGNFSGPAITDNNNGTARFNPSTLVPGGPYNIRYTYTDPLTGCQAFIINQVTIHPLPSATLTGNANICQGNPATLSLALNGSGPFSFTLFDGSGTYTVNNIAGPAYLNQVYPADTVTYTIPSVTDSKGCSTTGNGSAIINVLPQVSLVSQPVSQTACPGSNIIFRVEATGVNLQYQWERNGVPLAGATGNAIALNNVQAANIGAYRCIVSGDCGLPVTSNEAMLDLWSPVQILTQPLDIYECEGSNGNLQVLATGSNTSYQWYRNNIAISDGMGYSGTTNANLFFSPLMAAHAGNYHVTVSNACGTISSSEVTVKVDRTISIANQPQNVNVCEGFNAVYSVTATGDNLSYQWQKNMTDIPGETSSVLSLASCTAADEGFYRCIIRSSCGNEVFSDAAQLTVSVKPIISVNPVSITRCEGDNATFSVTATGSSLTYQWKKDGIDLSDNVKITGSRNSVLTINQAGGSDIGNYSCTVAGPCEFIGTTLAKLSVDTSLIITSQPVSVRQCINTNTFFSVSVEGNNLTYQWYKDGVAMAGKNGAVLVLNNILPADEGQYMCRISNFCGRTIDSNPAVLQINSSIAITLSPSDAEICTGDNAIFSAGATGSEILYQWEFNGSIISDNGNISGTNTGTLIIQSATKAQQGVYNCFITGACGQQRTIPASLIVNDPLSITGQPSGVTLCEGNNAEFRIESSGAEYFQWQKDEADLPGENTPVLVITNANASDSGVYRCIVFNQCDTLASDGALLEVKTPVMISTEPVPVTSCEGLQVQFEAEATGSDIVWQWYRNAVPISDGFHIAGTQTQTLTIDSLVPGQAGVYSAVAIGYCGEVTTEPAMLAVNPLPVIISQPSSLTVCENQSASFTIAVNGSVTFQWQKDNVDIAGETQPTLNIASAVSDAGVYRCKLTGTCGDLFSNAVQLTVNTNTSINLQPADYATCEDEQITLQVDARGTGLTYAWKKEGVILTDDGRLTGSTTATLLINQARISDEGIYQCVITAACGSVNSNTVFVQVHEKISITGQPQPIRMCNGSAASFEIQAAGSVLSYQWQKNNINIAGATNPVYTIPAVTADDSGTYSCIINGTCGQLSSQGARLKVDDLPAITTQPPAIQELCENNLLNAQVTATGTNLSYQWYFNGSALTDGGKMSGTTTRSLTINPVSENNEGVYYCQISNSCADIVTNGMQVWINQAATISEQPVNTEACIGQNIALKVTASGAGLTYQWQKNNVNIGGAVNPLLTLNNVSATDAGVYQCIVGSSCSQVISDAVQVTIYEPLAITSAPPSSLSRCAGTMINMSVAASGNILVYQWKKNGIPVSNDGRITGANSSVLQIANATTLDEGMYACEITGNCNTVSTGVTNLDIKTSPLVVFPPVDLSVLTGGNAMFSVTQQGDEPAWQWYFNGSALNDIAGISGSKTAILNISNATIANQGSYWVVITGACGTVTSNPASLSILTSSVITGQPSGAAKCEGESVTFSVETSGSGHSYQWKKNGTVLIDGARISGSHAAELSVTNLTEGDAGSYTCVIDNTENSVSAILTVSKTTRITLATGSNSLCTGQPASLLVKADGNLLTYAWFKNGVAVVDNATISGSTTSVLQIAPLGIGHSGSYICQLTGECGNATSDPLILSVSEPLVIAAQPSDSTICENQPVSLSVTVTGTVNSMQWYRNGIALIDDSRISGTRTGKLSITKAVKTDEGSYHCVITGLCNNVYSSLASVKVNSNIVISKQPTNIITCESKLAVFSVSINNVDAVYQWQKDGVDLSNDARISGSNASLLAISNLQASDAGAYRCRIISDCNTILSSPASLTVNRKAIINSQPAGNTICEGSDYVFNVGATGTSLSYLWLKDGAVLSDGLHFSGTRTATLNVLAATVQQAGTYQCIVNGSCSNIVSQYAILAVNRNTVIISQPVNSKLCEGNNLTLTATATGSIISYEWQKDNVALNEGVTYSGTKSDVLHISAATPAQSGIYRCVITGACNSVVSNTAQVKVLVPPAITLQPVNATVCEGTNVQINTAASGNDLHYTWKFNGGNLPPSDTNATLTLNNISKSQQGLYHCVVSNYCGSINTDPSTVIVNDRGFISGQPTDVAQCEGKQVSFSVNASGDNLNYQWQFNGSALSDGAEISGSLSRTLVITGITKANQGNYRCIVTDACSNTITSDPSALSVYEPVNLSGYSSGDTLCSGESLTLTVTATGSQLTYRWFVNGTVLTDGNGITGTSSSSVSITNASTSHSGYYSCEISGVCGKKLTAPIPVMVKQVVAITVDPVSLTKCEGESSVFSVAATGDNLTYQWMKDGNILSDGPGINGCTSSVLVLSSVSSAMAGSYYCIVSNSCITENSQAAALIIKKFPEAAGNITGDAIVCQGTSGVLYSVDAIPYADSYRWTLPPGMVVTSGDNTRQIEVSFSVRETGGLVYVEGINSCGSGSASPLLSITSKPLPVAYAGESHGICAINETLVAYDAGAPVTGIWQTVSGPAIIDFPDQASTPVSGLRSGANVFAWTATLNGCSASDTVTIYNNHVYVEAGRDTSICDHIYSLNAEVPAEGTGKWSIVYGSGYNIDRYNPESTVSGLSKGMNIFRWSVTNNGCVSYDSVIVTNNLPSESDAGMDQVIQVNYASLSANEPLIGTGQWSLLNGSAIIKNQGDHNTQVTELGQGKNIFEWTITFKGCVSSDTVVINNYITDTTDAGPNQTLCSTSVRLSAKNPYPGYGEWTVKRGSANFVQNSMYNTYAYNLAPGENVLIWTQYLNGVTYDSVIIINNLPSTANAGVGLSICTDSVMLNANKPYIGGGIWKVVSGAGIFTDDSLNNTEVKGLARGNNTFKWTIVNQGCTSSSTVTILNNKPTDAEAGFDLTTCEDSVVLNPNVPTFGKGEWSVFSGSAKFSGNLAYDLGRDENQIIYAIRNFGCYSRDTVIITSHKPTAAKLGPDQSICQDSVQLTSNSPSVGTGQWLLQSGSAMISSTSSSTTMARQLGSGENVFRWTINYKECSSFDDMTISNDFVMADAGNDVSICSDRTILAANDPGYSKGVWTIIGGSTGASILNPSASNSIVEKLSKGPNTLRWTISKNACSSFDEVIITNNEPTTAFAGENEFICSDQTQLRANTIIQGTGTWSILSGSGSVTDTHDPLASVSKLGPGINILRWTSENMGCYSTDEVIISNNLPLNVYAGLDQVICDDSAALYANPPVNGTGIWSVMLGSAFFEDPYVYNTPVKMLANGINKLKWTVSSTGCSVDDTVVIVNNLPTRAVAGSDFPVCNSTGSLNANTPLYGTGVWTLISGAGSIVSPSSPRTYINNLALGINTVQWTITNNNCVSVDQLTITNNSPSIADAGENAEVCGETAILYANSPVVGSGYWSVTSGTGSFTDSADYNTTVNGLNFGDNTLRWTTRNGECFTFDEIMITNNLASVYAGEDQVVYAPETLLTGNNPGKGTGEWILIAGGGDIASPASFSSGVKNLSAGLNTFEWTILNGTCTARDQVVINFKIMPRIGFTVSEAEGCPGTTVDFINTTQYGTTYRWELGDGSVSTEVNPSHTYSFADRFNVRLIAFGPDNRQVTTDTVIIIHNKPVTEFEFAPDTGFIKKPVRFYDGSYGDADNWLWNFGDNEFSSDQNPMHSFKSSGTFDITLIVTSDFGCSDTLTKSVVVAEDGILVFPNAFTPNTEGPNGGVYTENDHTNDVFHPYHENVAEFHMEIYSRWGVLLFETDDISVGWDGYYKGQLLNRDVYVWKATGKYVSGSEFLRTGNVLLVK